MADPKLEAIVRDGKTDEPTSPGDVPASSMCSGCGWGWERYQNPHGVWLHRNEADTLGCICTAEPENDGG